MGQQAVGKSTHQPTIHPFKSHWILRGEFFGKAGREPYYTPHSQPKPRPIETLFEKKKQFNDQLL